MVTLMVLEQRAAGEEDVNAVRCHECPNSVEDIPSPQTPRLSYPPTVDSQIEDTSSLNRYPLVSNSGCSKIVGTTCTYSTVFFGPNTLSDL